MSTPPPTASDRTLAAMRSLVLSFFPALKYYFCHEYSVAASDGSTFSGTPTDPTFSPPLPTRVPYAPSLAGSTCVVPNGTLAHVVFVNADPSKPRCVGFDLPTIPTSVTVDASGRVAVGASASGVSAGTAYGFALRSGDVVTHNGFTGPVVFVSAGSPGVTPIAGQSNVKV